MFIYALYEGVDRIEITLLSRKKKKPRRIYWPPCLFMFQLRGISPENICESNVDGRKDQ